MSSETEARLAFTELLACRDEEIPLDQAALLIARAEYPSLDVDRYLARLDAMAAELRPRLSPEERPERLLAVVNEYLFGEESFYGNAADYYDPRNSYLNDVLDRRMGIPITLSLLYIELGRRLGLPIEGVGLPGHFIIRCATAYGGILVDPFGQGAVLTEDDCRARVQQLYGQRMAFTPGLLQPARRREIVVRMLSNLKGAYLRRGDTGRALRTATWIVAASPDQPFAVRELGLLRLRAGDLKGAIRELKRYLELDPRSALARRTRTQLDQIRQLWIRRN